MKPLAAQMAQYSSYHRHPVNRAIHFLGIPAIVWSLMVYLSMLPGVQTSQLNVTPAVVAVAALLLYYLALDFGLGVAATLLFTVLLVTAIQLVDAGSRQALVWATVAFVGGWVVQFVGHGVWEKRRPALMDNLFQVFVAPIFLVAEAAFALGMRKPLHQDVEARVAAMHEA